MTGTRPEELLQLATTWLDEGRGVAVSTVMETWGSAPQPVGSKLVVDDTGRFEGSVSGGCVEGAVITESCTAIQTGVHRILEFGVSNDDAWSMGLACGGTIGILVEPVRAASDKHRHINKIVEGVARREGFVRTVDLKSGNDTVLPLDTNEEIDTQTTFREKLIPAPRIIAVGAAHLSQSLSVLAKTAGFGFLIVDPRTAFASDERFPGISLDTRWPDQALKDIGVDGQTAVCALTHDPKLDDPALKIALNSNAFYIGALGSRKTSDARNQRLITDGIDAQQLDRIRAPIGLTIGAIGAPEIAVAIMAEIIAVWRNHLPSN